MISEWKSAIERCLEFEWNSDNISGRMNSTFGDKFELLGAANIDIACPRITESVEGRNNFSTTWLNMWFPPEEFHWDGGIDPYTCWRWSDFQPDLNEYDALWSYIMDLDRDAFTVYSAFHDAFVHYRLSNMPEKIAAEEDSVDSDISSVDSGLGSGDVEKGDLENNTVIPDLLPVGIHFINLAIRTPLPKEKLLKLYRNTSHEIVDPPFRSNHPTWFILQKLHETLRRNYHLEFQTLSKDWTPLDRPMQILAYLIIRFAMWDGLSFETSEFAEKIQDRKIVDANIVPNDPQYFLRVGAEEKVLISLATHLDDYPISVTEVAKVMELYSAGGVKFQKACIVSLNEVMIVWVETSPHLTFRHTPGLSFSAGNGVRALMATLNPGPLPETVTLPGGGVAEASPWEGCFFGDGGRLYALDCAKEPDRTVYQFHRYEFYNVLVDGRRLGKRDAYVAKVYRRRTPNDISPTPSPVASPPDSDSDSGYYSDSDPASELETL